MKGDFHSGHFDKWGKPWRAAIAQFNFCILPASFCIRFPGIPRGFFDKNKKRTLIYLNSS